MSFEGGGGGGGGAPDGLTLDHIVLSLTGFSPWLY